MIYPYVVLHISAKAK